MNRFDFLKSIGIGALTLPAILNAVSEPQTRTLVEWLDDVRHGHPKTTFIASPDVVEYFRREFPRNPGDGFCKFAFEQMPYRYDRAGHIVSPYSEKMTSKGRMTALNPGWVNAPTEICIAYAGSTVFWAPFNRKTYRLLPT